MTNPSAKKYALSFELEGLTKLPNQILGSHWRVRSTHAAKWKRAVWAKAWPFKPPQPLAKAIVTVTRGSSVRPDFDGLAGSAKALIDGLVECGVLDNDSMDVIGEPKFLWEPAPRGKGFMRVKVEGL